MTGRPALSVHRVKYEIVTERLFLIPNFLIFTVVPNCSSFIVYIYLTLVDCVWSEWTDWGACSETCNGGTQDRVRVQTEEQSLGGRPCTGFDTEFQPCMTDPCPGKLINVNQA